jgi:hypothetical protein
MRTSSALTMPLEINPESVCSACEYAHSARRGGFDKSRAQGQNQRSKIKNQKSKIKNERF